MVLNRCGVGTFVFALIVVVSGCDASGEQHEHQHSKPVATLSDVMNNDSHGGAHHTSSTASDPTLAGQYVFATVSEVVALLEADPATDWSTVDLERLRQHLIDMDRVTMDASVDTKHVEHGAIFVVKGTDSRTEASIQRMVSAHAQTMVSDGAELPMTTPESEPWQYVATPVDGGMSLTVTASDEQGASRIRGLGFIGVLVRGNHHPLHHLALATGQEPHHGSH